MTLWSRDWGEVILQIENVQLHFYKTYDHQTWQGNNLWERPPLTKSHDTSITLLFEVMLQFNLHSVSSSISNSISIFYLQYYLHFYKTYDQKQFYRVGTYCEGLTPLKTIWSHDYVMSRTKLKALYLLFYLFFLMEKFWWGKFIRKYKVWNSKEIICYFPYIIYLILMHLLKKWLQKSHHCWLVSNIIFMKFATSDRGYCNA